MESERERIEQSNDISGLILSTVGVEQGHFIVLHDRFAIADALWAAGYRKVDLVWQYRAVAMDEERNIIDSCWGTHDTEDAALQCALDSAIGERVDARYGAVQRRTAASPWVEVPRGETNRG